MFIRKLKELDDTDYKAGIDFLYDYIDDLIDNNDMETIDKTIRDFMQEQEPFDWPNGNFFSLSMTVAFLTIANVRKTRLVHWEDLLEYAHKVAERKKTLTQEQIDNILSGF